jgi:hypothetical protein
VTIELFHKAPEGYSYEQEKNFKPNITAIWLRHHKQYDYNLGKPVKTIWGFYHTKKQLFYAPVNAKTVGKVVDIRDTTPYTSMKIKQTPLEAAFS